ncbi:MAG: hypothetical protein CMP76_07535 [Flavobacterium sp.]|uniref:hypothetical protein n=1 Tax=Flavobacterium sp. TaxID=239 RepID=UPI000C3B65D1|nr:hypothetical protein [Flavobacterium sp.]MBF03133.1 hypothetical protein [Flavobacterium sp.]
MKRLILTLLFTLATLNTFSQKVDWVNAPMNPIPNGVDLKFHNLKGDVLQESILNYFTRDGKWFSYEGNEEIAKDNQGRAIVFKDYQGNSYSYKYDEKGNLIENKYNEAPPVIYTYDNLNRVVKESYKDNQNRIRSSEYSYEKKGDLLIVKEIKIEIGGEKNEKETHFRNGIEVYEKFKGYSATKFEYLYDAKGNWISKSFIDAETNTTKLSSFDNKPIKPRTRDIIYYSDFDKGVSAFSVVLEDITKGKIPNTPLLARPHINGKELKKQLLFCRLGNDYVFYIPISKSYYIARNAYANTNKDGQKLPVEKLITEAENIIVANSKNVRVIENGKTTADGNEWKTINYTNALSSYVSVNQKSGRAYAFENMPPLSDTRTVAVAGKQIAGLWYVPISNKNDVYIFENGIYVQGKYTLVGFLVNTSSPVIQVGEATKKYYVLSDFDKAIDKKFFKARLFNTSTDKIEAQKSNTTAAATTAKSATANKISTETQLTEKDSCLSGDCINTFSKKRFANGEIIEGFFENGKINGVGTHTLPNGNYYIGNFKDGNYDGYGIYSWKSEGVIYYGTWQKGLQNGYGYQLKNSKAVVAGYYTNGKLTRDMLTYDYVNNIYKSNCAGDCANGFGQYKYSDRSWYYGFFQNSKPHYLGMYKNNEGDLYMGQFIANKMEGVGTLLYKSDRQSYIGQFSNSNFNGQGYKMDRNSVVIQKGNWVNGVLRNSNFTIEKPKPVNLSSKTLSAEAKAYFDVYNSNPDGLKQHLANLDKKWKAKVITGDLLGQFYASLINEIYQVAPEAAFEFMMKMDKDATKDTLPKLKTDVRDYIREKSKERIQKYTRSN